MASLILGTVSWAIPLAGLICLENSCEGKSRKQMERKLSLYPVFSLLLCGAAILLALLDFCGRIDSGDFSGLMDLSGGIRVGAVTLFLGTAVLNMIFLWRKHRAKSDISL